MLTDFGCARIELKTKLLSDSCNVPIFRCGTTGQAPFIGNIAGVAAYDGTRGYTIAQILTL